MSNFDHDAHAALAADREIPSWQIPAPARDRTPKTSSARALAILASVVTFFLGSVGTFASLALIDTVPFLYLLGSLVTMIGGAVVMSFVTVPAKV